MFIVMLLMNEINKTLEKSALDDYNLLIKYKKIAGEKSFEFWKIIPNFSKYECSTDGKIRRTYDKKIMKTYINGGYETISLWSDNNKNKNKKVRVHTLIANTFINNKNPKLNNVIDHINNNKLDNRIINLRWVTQSMNMKSHHDNFRKYIGNKILQYDLNNNLIKEWLNIKEILDTNKNYQYVYLMSRINKNKIVYGYYWNYKENTNYVPKEDEIFRNIGVFKNKNFSKYEVSNYGNVRNTKNKNKILSPRITNTYLAVTLCDDINKEYTYYIHQLVAFKFIENNNDENNVVNHIDENKLNNYYKNLEYISIKENTVYSCGKKVKQINIDTGEIIKIHDCISDAYRSLGKTKCNSHISRCCVGKENSALGFKWEYAD